MYFTSGSDRAFEQLMQGKPGFDHYDSGEAVTPEDCGTCRFYRPHWKYQFCVYAECPYQPGKLTAYDAVTFRVKGVENMAVFRVERNKGYTVMSNHHLRNKDLSLKAKGLLSQMLSLPEDWDYTLKGLSLINREQIDAIRAAIRELEQAGYIVRSRERDSQGRLRGADYVIYEQPQPVPDSPTLENPMLIDGIMGNLSGLFSTVNTKVGEIASDVGTTPQAWNSGIFNMLQSLSDTVIVPIAAAILAVIMCYELIDMIVEKNNMIDGVLNNAPTMSELEAKAKAGEQISLFDVAEAAKAEAQKPKQPQRPAQKQKKPSIRAQLKAAKEEQQKKPPQREKAQELEV